MNPRLLGLLFLALTALWAPDAAAADQVESPDLTPTLDERFSGGRTLVITGISMRGGGTVVAVYGLLIGYATNFAPVSAVVAGSGAAVALTGDGLVLLGNHRMNTALREAGFEVGFVWGRVALGLYAGALVGTGAFLLTGRSGPPGLWQAAFACSVVQFVLLNGEHKARGASIHLAPQLTGESRGLALVGSF